MQNGKLNVQAFALACALVWGVGLFLMTWWIITLEGATYQTTFIGYIYRGYNISPIGSFIGLAWALVDGMIGGAVFAVLYNLLSAKDSNKNEAQS